MEGTTGTGAEWTARHRPRFEVELPTASRAAFEAALRAELSEGDPPCAGAIVGRFADLRIRRAERRFFSPRLEVEVVEAERGVVLRVRMGPEPDVWTFFAAGYAVLLCAGVAAGVWGAAQATLGEPPWAWAGIPAAAALAGFWYGAALIGRGLGAEQAHLLRVVLERISERAAS